MIEEWNDVSVSSRRQFIFLFHSPVVISVGLIVATAWRIRKIEDGFYIKTELRAMGFSGVLYVLFLVVVIAVPPEVDFKVKMFVRWFPLQLFTIASIHYPVWLSYYRKYYQTVATSGPNDASGYPQGSKSMSLMDILVKEEFAAAHEDFKEHLTREFSVENIIFFREALEFANVEEGLSKEELSARTVEIFLNFFVDDAPLEVFA